MKNGLYAGGQLNLGDENIPLKLEKLSNTDIKVIHRSIINENTEEIILEVDGQYETSIYAKGVINSGENPLYIIHNGKEVEIPENLGIHKQIKLSYTETGEGTGEYISVRLRNMIHLGRIEKNTVNLVEESLSEIA